MQLDFRPFDGLPVANRIAVALFMLGFLVAPVFGQDGPTNEQALEGLAYRFWIMIFAALIALISRFFLLRRLNKLMLSESKKASEFPVQETQTPEVPAGRALAVVEKDISSVFKSESENRRTLLAGARAAVNRQFLTQIIIVAAYAAGFYLVLDDEFYYYALYLSENSDTEALRVAINHYNAYRWLLMFYGAWTVLMFLNNRLYFSGAGRKGLVSVIQGFWGTTLAVLVLLYTLFYSMTLFAPSLLIAPAIHLALWYWLKRQGRKRTNARLLILRVFLLKKTSKFTFNGLVKAWQHLGNYFTASDPSFFKVSWKRRFRHTFPVYILVIFFIYTLATDTNKETEAEIFSAFIFMLIIGNFIYVLNARSRMKLNFASSPQVLEKRFRSVERKPTRADNTFREVPIMCFDNTWRQAVDGMIDTADVVLMDLRGFSEENLGSSYEINVLFDKVPADRIVFMAYEETVPLVRRVIDQQWEMLAENSPNLGVENPSTTLYTVSRENRREMQGILAALLDATHTDTHGDNA